MLTLLTKRVCRIVNNRAMDQHILIGAAIAVGCGMGLGWTLSNLTRAKHTDKSAISTEFEIGSVGTSEEFKLVLVVRNDLKMGKGKVAAQCCHAAVMAYEQLYKRHPKLLEEWRYHGQPKVVLRTDSEAELLELAASARARGLVVSVVQDAGRTQIAPGSKTVVGIGPEINVPSIVSNIDERALLHCPQLRGVTRPAFVQSQGPQL